MLRIIFYVVGRVIAGLVAGLGLAFDYTGESVLTLSSDRWGIIGLFAFGVFVVITLIREIDFALLQRPEIKVESVVRNNRAILEVQNIGGEAEFTAKARVIATIPEAELYTMYWESERGTKCHIDGNGGVASILVGKIAEVNRITSDIETNISKGSLVLLKMGTSGEQIFPAFSVERSVEKRGDMEVISGSPIDRCIVEITLTSTPTLKKKWGTHKYLCEIEKGEIKFYETDLSVPHTEASQPE